MKKLIIILLLLPFTLFAQEKNDTIKSISKGDIFCKIKTVSNGNIYYYIGESFHFISLNDVNYYSGHGKVTHETKEKKPEWVYKPDSNKYMELVCISHANILSTLVGGDVNVAQKFDIYVNPYSDSAKNRALTPFLYTIDALNFFAVKGYDLKNVFSVFTGTGKDIEIRHYILAKK
jgi:hypothetical protein